MMTHYVDGFLIPMHPDKVSEYQKIASRAGEVWMKHGALAYWECLGDDLHSEGLVSFKQSAGCKDDETVIFAWIVYPSREDRDRINEAVMEDPALSDMMDQDNPPFDCTRMAYGGFKELVRYQP